MFTFTNVQHFVMCQHSKLNNSHEIQVSWLQIIGCQTITTVHL